MIQENEEYPKYEEKETEKDLPRNQNKRREDGSASSVPRPL